MPPTSLSSARHATFAAPFKQARNSNHQSATHGAIDIHTRLAQTSTKMHGPARDASSTNKDHVYLFFSPFQLQRLLYISKQGWPVNLQQRLHQVSVSQPRSILHGYVETSLGLKPCQRRPLDFAGIRPLLHVHVELPIEQRKATQHCMAPDKATALQLAVTAYGSLWFRVRSLSNRTPITVPSIEYLKTRLCTKT